MDCVVPKVVRLPHEAVTVRLLLVLHRQTAAHGDKSSGVGYQGPDEGR